MFLVVPTKKSLRKNSAILNAPEAVRELRPVFYGAELAFRIRIVVGDVRPAVCFGHTQVGQSERHRLGTHRRAAIGMQRELSGSDVLFCTALLDQALGQLRAFAYGHHPAGDVAAEDIEDHLEINVGPLRRAQQLGVNRRTPLAIVGSARRKQRTASGTRAHGDGQFNDRGHSGVLLRVWFWNRTAQQRRHGRCCNQKPVQHVD